MNSGRIHSLLSNLDHAVEILAENRTPDALCVAAFDTLKQARALVARAFSNQIDGAGHPATPAGRPPAMAAG